MLLAQTAPLPNTVNGIVTIQSFEGLFSNVISVAIGLAGIVFFIMFIVGGFSYLTAGGEEQKVAGAKKTLTYAIFGLFAIVLSFLILKFIANFTGVTSILNFKVVQ